MKKSVIQIITIAASVAVVCIAAGAYSLIKYTTSAKSFCMSCHWNQGYSEFSKQSVIHPERIACDDCHARNAEMIPTGFSAVPELVSENCIRCHKDIQFSNEWENLKTNVQEIQIGHELHLTKAGLLCVDCHNTVAHDRNSNSTNRPHMSKCFECHQSEDEGCGSCHPMGFLKIESEISEISVSACNKCHVDFLRRDRDGIDGGFSHTKHLVKLLECGACHNSKEQHPLLMPEGEDCGNCHHGKTDKGCIECHPLQNKLFLGIKEGEEWSYPDPMANIGMSCNIGCHVDLKEGHSFGSVRKTCITCHSGEYGEIVDEFQLTEKELIDEINDILSEITKKSAEDGKQAEKVRRIVKKAAEDINFIERAKGVHNMQYVISLLHETKKSVSSLLADVTVE